MEQNIIQNDVQNERNKKLSITNAAITHYLYEQQQRLIESQKLESNKIAYNDSNDCKIDQFDIQIEDEDEEDNIPIQKIEQPRQKQQNKEDLSYNHQNIITPQKGDRCKTEASVEWQRSQVLTELQEDQMQGRKKGKAVISRNATSFYSQVVEKTQQTTTTQNTNNLDQKTIGRIEAKRSGFCYLTNWENMRMKCHEACKVIGQNAGVRFIDYLTFQISHMQQFVKEAKHLAETFQQLSLTLSQNHNNERRQSLNTAQPPMQGSQQQHDINSPKINSNRNLHEILQDRKNNPLPTDYIEDFNFILNALTTYNINGKHQRLNEFGKALASQIIEQKFEEIIQSTQSILYKFHQQFCEQHKQLFHLNEMMQLKWSELGKNYAEQSKQYFSRIQHLQKDHNSKKNKQCLIDHDLLSIVMKQFQILQDIYSSQNVYQAQLFHYIEEYSQIQQQYYMEVQILITKIVNKEQTFFYKYSEQNEHDALYQCLSRADQMSQNNFQDIILSIQEFQYIDSVLLNKQISNQQNEYPNNSNLSKLKQYCILSSLPQDYKNTQLIRFMFDCIIYGSNKITKHLKNRPGQPQKPILCLLSIDNRLVFIHYQSKHKPSEESHICLHENVQQQKEIKMEKLFMNSVIIKSIQCEKFNFIKNENKQNRFELIQSQFFNSRKYQLELLKSNQEIIDEIFNQHDSSIINTPIELIVNEIMAICQAT